MKTALNKRGFTLVELLVGFAIFGVICLALVGFITMSANSYRRTSSMINLQIEYQITMSMIQAYAVECKDSIEVRDGELHIDSYVFRFREGDGLFLASGASGGNDDIVSRYVTAFEAEIRPNNLLAVTVTFEHLGRVYSATQLTHLRNNPDTGGVNT
jgi:prepilin-type N-terminal cleavage/methylation domain-containing protein